MSDVDVLPLVSSPHAALDELVGWRMELRRKIAGRLEQLDPADPNTLQFGVSAMLEAHYKPKDLSALLGPSQTTIGRWAIGQTIPRSAPFRKWLVAALIRHLHSDHAERPEQALVVNPPEPVTPDRPPAHRKPVTVRQARKAAQG